MGSQKLFKHLIILAVLVYGLMSLGDNDIYNRFNREAKENYFAFWDDIVLVALCVFYLIYMCLKRYYTLGLDEIAGYNPSDAIEYKITYKGNGKAKRVFVRSVHDFVGGWKELCYPLVLNPEKLTYEKMKMFTRKTTTFETLRSWMERRYSTETYRNNYDNDIADSNSIILCVAILMIFGLAVYFVYRYNNGVFPLI